MADKLSWAWSQGSWYVVDYAKSGRSSCKEFRCKQKIDAGELRIGIEAPEDDHRGTQLGWYHPACLWKTFTYKTNANKEIQSREDIQGFAKLKQDDQTLIENLLSGKQIDGPPAPVGTSAPSTALRRKVITKIEGNTMTLTGPTFHIKEDLKKFGAKFNGETKAWVITKKDNDTFDDIEKFLAGDSQEETSADSAAKRRRT
ncbi:PARP1 [Symbiodinium natans]|uniref:PARP1 protein n=1 Tax=Symbiodinium natans TaxID=878477 RepID=A0A812GTR5_9DINO|nr:PARP1 [Symbiodinium natans]